MPSLSILLLCWNHRPYLEQCIESLRAQTSNDFEVIFLDNVSTDGSFDLASILLGDLNVPVTLIRNDQPQWISHNINRLFAASSGNLVAPLSTDDWYAPTYVEAMIGAANKHPQAGIYTCLGWLYFENEARLEEVSGSRYRDGNVFLPFMRGEQPFFAVGYCFRRAVVEEAGRWDEQQSVEDLDFLARVTRSGIVQQLAERLVYYRRHSRSTSFDLALMREGCERFYAKHACDTALNMRHWMAERYSWIAAVHIDRRERREAAFLLGKSLWLRPLRRQTYRTAIYLARTLWARA